MNYPPSSAASLAHSSSPPTNVLYGGLVDRTLRSTEANIPLWSEHESSDAYFQSAGDGTLNCPEFRILYNTVRFKFAYDPHCAAAFGHIAKSSPNPNDAWASMQRSIIEAPLIMTAFIPLSQTLLSSPASSASSTSSSSSSSSAMPLLGRIGYVIRDAYPNRMFINVNYIKAYERACTFFPPLLLFDY